MADQDTPDTIPTKGTNAYLDYVIELAKGPTLEQGVINEPRMYFDILDTAADLTTETFGNPDAIYNRELFPVRLTHLTAAVRWTGAGGSAALPSLIQAAALQLRYHDQFYMSAQALPIPVWANKPVAAPDVVSPAMSAWDFVSGGSKPPILAKQDTFQVQVRCDDPDATLVDANNPLPVTVTFTGFGLLSRRPYIFSSGVQLTSFGTIVPISANGYRNDGNEPIIITDMTVLVGPQQTNQVFQPGDIRRISLNVRQVGSGTGSWWFSGPNGTSVCPASLLGITTGRAVVHQFPGIGQLFGPADGITVMVQHTQNPALNDFVLPLVLGFAGYIMVT